MKKALLKDSIKEIKNTYKRFLSILLMAFLGVGFFAGIKATSPDMVDTIDKYYKEQNVYDIQTISTLGLTKDDVDELGKIEGIKSIEGSYEVDGKIEIDNKEIVSKILTLEDINRPVLIEGKLPEAEDECVVEDVFLIANNKKIGDKIIVDIEQISNDDGEKQDYLKQKEMKIVGTVKSPIYISRDRGTTNLGSGKINYYMYISPKNINVPEIYTSISIKIDTNATTSSKKYEEKVEEVKEKIEEKKAKRQKARYDSLVGKATKKVEDAEKRLNDEKGDASEKLDKAQRDIDNGKKEISNKETELNNSEAKANREFSNASNQIKNGKRQIKENEDKLIQSEKDLKQLTQTKGQLEASKKKIEDGLNEINKQIENLELALQNPMLEEAQKVALTKTKEQLEKNKTDLLNKQQEVNEGIKNITLGIEQGKSKIPNGKNQLQNAKRELTKKEQEFNRTKQKVQSKIANGRKEIEKAKEKIAKGEEELKEKRAEFDKKIKDAETKLIDAKTKIGEIEEPKWYILDRYGNIGYNSFIQDTESVANLGKVFPIVFFVVATLISLTSMTRMVEEQRVQIGTLKALGYNKIQIAGKYILYASLACVFGGILGMGVGFVLLPKIIWMMYEMMYRICEIHLEFNWLYGGIGLILISICIIGATIYTAMKELIQTPATLMRPKAPKIGKRVFLERIKFIWKRLSFSKKVTVRNIFRYKKRFLMTIIGICGCTSLILAGFGIKDSISHILPIQFENVHHYDMQVSLKNGLEEKQKNEYIKKLKEDNVFKNITETYMNSSKVIKNDKEEEIQIIIPSDKIDDAVTLKDVKTKEKITLKDDEIYLTDKVAQLLDAKVGEKIILKDNDDKEREITIKGVCENYIYHYMYMTKATYEKIYEKPYKTNVLFINYNNIENEEELAKNIMEDKEVASVMRISAMKESLNDMMNSLNYVVIVLIVSAGLLAFVVLYNLANVNISERIRELATIKVLGFYDREVYSYVSRETVILTIIGIVLGVFGGYFLNYFILGTCEIDMLRFAKIVKPMSVVYSVLITLIFTFIVNLITYFTLKKIDMIESLKSVE